MSFNGDSLMPIEQALDYLLSQVSVSTEQLEVDLPLALGLVLAEPLTASMNVPAHDNSAMDGFAVRRQDLQDSETQLPISQTIAAGYVGDALAPGTAARIFTGAPIPTGADVVVIQENTRFENGSVTILERPDSGKNIRLKGHDIAIGETVLEAGHKFRPQDMGLLSSLGISKVKVQKPLTVAIINTGDEVVSPNQPLAPGQIYDSNSFTLDALLQQLGFKTLKLGIIEDDLQSTEAALTEAAEKADCIVTTGGVSVGDEDYVKKAVENLGELSLWKLAIKPGKPFSYGHIGGHINSEINGQITNTPFFGLPGNPVAVFVTFTMLVKPCLLKMQGASSYRLNEFKLKAGFEIKHSGTRQEYIRVRLIENEEGQQELLSFSNQGSSIMTSLSWADGLAVIPKNISVAKGDLLSYIPFSGLL